MVPPNGGHRKANGAEPRRASIADHPTLPRAAAVVKPRARVRAHSVHRGRFFVRDDPCALLREPNPGRTLCMGSPNLALLPPGCIAVYSIVGQEKKSPGVVAAPRGFVYP